MKFPKIQVAYTIIFNNTGLDWTDIQPAICKVIEQEYCVLHCVGDKWYEKLDTRANYVVIKDIPCNLYFRVANMQIEVVAIKSVFKDAENRKWISENPENPRRELYLVTVNRKSDNHTWVQNMIWNGYAEKWLWDDDPQDKPVNDSEFEIIAWQSMPAPARKPDSKVCVYDDSEGDDKW